MRYHIDTIPVWDALKQESECPLCELQESVEKAYLESFLGASVMEPDVRIEVNEKGFCRRHFARMFEMKNRLGLGLMTHTHFQEERKKLIKPEKQKAGWFKKRQTAAGALEEPCILCERLSDTMDRYQFTVLHLWTTDPEFQKAFGASKGFCLPHYRGLAAMAERELGGEKAAKFLEALMCVQTRNMERVEKELEWFTLKFDYRNGDKPWGNSKDALERAINKLRGKCI